MARTSFIESCCAAAEYPKNLLYSCLFDHENQAYHENLEERKESLFVSSEDKPVVATFHYDEKRHHYRERLFTSLDDLRARLPYTGANLRRDSRNTFIFWQAVRNSRDPLQLTAEMACYQLAYFQIKPFFLDFLFLFGRKLYAQGFHFSSFRHRTAILERFKENPIDSLGRSGAVIEICFNLQGVEKDSRPGGRPWSIRHAVAYHKIDVVSGCGTWLFVKGNQLLKDRLQCLLGQLTHGQNPDDLAQEGLSNSLQVYILLCDWAVENWRWYINYLEDTFNGLSRKAIEQEVIGSPTSPQVSETTCVESKGEGPDSPKAKRVPWPWHTRKRSQTDEEAFPMYLHPSATAGHPLEPPEPPPPPMMGTNSDIDLFKFGDLQRVQHIEEKVNEAVLVLKSNVKTIARIKAYFLDLRSSKDVPRQIIEPETVKDDLMDFEDQLTSLETDLAMHQTRAESLLTLVAHRKTLLFGILDFYNAAASRDSANKAGVSTKNMEELTREMKSLTHRTKQETVMMRVITLVTMFFLPGTFISTLMSTDIVKFPNGRKGLGNGVVSEGAIALYLLLTIPLMAFTLIAWYLFYLYVNREGESKGSAQRHK